jgi:hypothetical protein
MLERGRGDVGDGAQQTVTLASNVTASRGLKNCHGRQEKSPWTVAVTVVARGMG